MVPPFNFVAFVAVNLNDGTGFEKSNSLPSQTSFTSQGDIRTPLQAILNCPESVVIGSPFLNRAYIFFPAMQALSASASIFHAPIFLESDSSGKSSHIIESVSQ